MLNKYIWLLTIKHTGTHYMMECLKQLHIQQGKMSLGNMKVHGWPGAYIHLHICEPSNNALSTPDGKVIVTLRDPVAVYRSWMARYMESVEQSLIYVYKRFDEAVKKFDPFIFRVDGNETQQIDGLAQFLGIERLAVSVANKERNIWPKERYAGNVPASIERIAQQYGY